jgi:UDP-glucose 4-epimerase
MNNKLLENDVINIGSDKLMTVLELAKLVIKLTNSKSQIVHLPPLKEGDMTRRQPDNTKMKEILGRELISVEEGIKRMMASEKYLQSIGL